MDGQSGEGSSSRQGEKLLLFVGDSLVVISLLSLAVFIALSAFSLAVLPLTGAPSAEEA
jgi:hypothetical protein